MKWLVNRRLTACHMVDPLDVSRETIDRANGWYGARITGRGGAFRHYGRDPRAVALA
ncbi:hypothetical protein KB20921_15800 [Edwardsiella ictaluri]|nr:hypothetical protein KH20906_15520 [Edwardsiella ictaluri]BEI02319.1 hypothetical protein KB20921_15800 [Edwardsiella ictaluri]BEI05786.1 hypothetical protein KH201010_15720 [Edwardsiella ictaluri]BEI09242.1 hypothetical protein STU22726_15730 [Edwardsiella ictaluri]BEI12721.1 hypothetical protein STU22816_15740 [Edwardsiella ictaluri]